MKPIIILPPDSMSDADIAELRANDICVVTSKEPAKVEFVDPIPAISSRTEIEAAAIKFSRKVLQWSHWENGPTSPQGAYYNAVSTFVNILVSGSPLDPKTSKQELGKVAGDQAYLDECRQIAREEARAERAAAKAKVEAEKAAKKKPSTAA